MGAARIFLYDTGEGSAVLMLHGFNHHAEAWARNIADVAAAGHRVVVPDLPGFGRSGVPPMRYSLRGYADFVADLAGVLDLASVHLVGNSMGGAIALRTAIDHPGLVRSVTAVDPAGMFSVVPFGWTLAANRLVQRVIRPFMGRRRMIEEGHRRAYHDPAHFDMRQVDLIAEAWTQPGYAEHILRMAETMLLAPADELLWEKLPGIRVPVLVAWGREDRTLPLRHAYHAAQRIPGAELRVYDRCGHLPMYEKATEFNRDVVAFLSRVDGGAKPGN